jgi:hypothetical protein
MLFPPIARRCLSVVCILLVPISVAYLLNRQIFPDRAYAARFTGFGSLALWVSYPYFMARFYREQLNVRPGDDAWSLTVLFWGFVGVGLVAAALATFVDGLTPIAWLVLVECVAASFAIAASLLAIQQVGDG